MSDDYYSVAYHTRLYSESVEIRDLKSNYKDLQSYLKIEETHLPSRVCEGVYYIYLRGRGAGGLNSGLAS